MLNEIVNELSTAREGRLLSASNEHITRWVFNAVKRRSPGAEHGLQGIDAEADGVTRPMWDQAVYAASGNGSIVFGEAAIRCIELSRIQPVIYEDVIQFIAERVATAILVIHGIKG
jgi:hypothetical protein